MVALHDGQHTRLIVQHIFFLCGGGSYTRGPKFPAKKQNKTKKKHLFTLSKGLKRHAWKTFRAISQNRVEMWYRNMRMMKQLTSWPCNHPWHFQYRLGSTLGFKYDVILVPNQAHIFSNSCAFFFFRRAFRVRGNGSHRT